MHDSRNIENGREIPTESYCDQPYVVITDDGAWLCVVTTGSGLEGQSGQHIISMRSTDMGTTWSRSVDIEPVQGPEASYAVLLKVPQGHNNAGRVYVFYNHNSDNIRKVIADRPAFPDGWCHRVDSLGHFCFKYSDDNGTSWSSERYDIPMRKMAIDCDNPYAGQLLFFWNVGRPFIQENRAYCPLTKVGGFGEGFFTRSEGVLLMSENLLDEPNPAHLTWQTLPDGEYGLGTPTGGGPIAEEHSYIVLGDGSICTVYRSIDGHPVESYSRDGGHTWTKPQYRHYANGCLMKHPRAANFQWACGNGRYLYWYHNHGGRHILDHSQRRTMAYNDRNPVWLSVGHEVATPKGFTIAWSQPEIVLYDQDTRVRISYPDLVMDKDRFFLTETQKEQARVHEIPQRFLHTVLQDDDPPAITRNGLILELAASTLALTRETPQQLQFFGEPSSHHNSDGSHQGLTIELCLCLNHLTPGQIILDHRDANNRSLCLRTSKHSTIEIVLDDGCVQDSWDCDREMIQTGKDHHLAIIIDTNPKIISFVVDGKLCDGGNDRQFGWSRLNPRLQEIAPSCSSRENRANPDIPRPVQIAPHFDGNISMVRIYERSLLTTEVIDNYRTMMQTNRC